MTAPARPDSFARFERRSGVVADIVLDLGADVGSRPGRTWRLCFDGVSNHSATEDVLLDLLMQRKTPVASIREAGRVVAVARLGAEFSGGFVAAIEDYLCRTISLVTSALTGTARAITVFPGEPEPVPAHSGVTARRAGVAAARQVVGAALRQVYHRVYDSPHWCVGWRRLQGPDVIELGRHPDTGWTTLPDDGHRFYADPFPIAYDDGLTLFVEEFHHRSGKGVISAVEFDASGPAGRPEVVLELPYHLSYPFVFARDGELWMIPESCASGTIDLFRATSFPGGWVKQATLVADVVASDATLLQWDGRWWMFATVRDGGGTFSDMLHLWWADDFRGPWTAHPANPVLIDIAAARPAGRLVERDGTLFRPVQDCRRGYGRALAIARVTALDPQRFEQVIEATLTAGPLWSGDRLHTLNSAGGFEFIDGSSRIRRKRLSRP